MSEALKITSETLKRWGACNDGYHRFMQLWPDGADLKTASEGLANDGHEDWSRWLYDKCRGDEQYKSQAEGGFRNSGHWNSGHWNSGDWNSGDRNSGDRNSGDWNSGHWNSGHWNSGDWNSGHWNSGDWNSGHRNSGHWNSGHRNSGFFNSTVPDEVRVFNQPCPRSEWNAARKPGFIYGIETTYWVDESKMSDAEKAADPHFYVRGGQLRSRSYKDAWKAAWESATAEDKALLVALPRFDPAVFREITGIDVIATVASAEAAR